MKEEDVCIADKFRNKNKKKSAKKEKSMIDESKFRLKIIKN